MFADGGGVIWINEKEFLNDYIVFKDLYRKSFFILIIDHYMF